MHCDAGPDHQIITDMKIKRITAPVPLTVMNPDHERFCRSCAINPVGSIGTHKSWPV